MIPYLELVIGALAGMIYGGAAYFKQREGPNPEEFDPLKLISTMIIGAVVGLALANTGAQASASAIENGLLIGTTMGFTALVENILKTIWRAANKS